MVLTVASLSDSTASGAGVRAAPAAACVFSARDLQYFAARGPELQVGAILLTPESGGQKGSRLRSGSLEPASGIHLPLTAGRTNPEEDDDGFPSGRVQIGCTRLKAAAPSPGPSPSPSGTRRSRAPGPGNCALAAHRARGPAGRTAP